jgi:hypothetical protein
MQVEARTTSAESQAMSPEVKVELPRLVPRGVASHEITRDHKVVRCAKDTLAQWNQSHDEPTNELAARPSSGDQIL